MELSQVRYFVALCSERNFTRAAKQCRISQPSLSNGIKALERELGGELFLRASMVLTPLGKRVRPHLETAFASVARAQKAAGDYQRRSIGRHAVVARRHAVLSGFGAASPEEGLRGEDSLVGSQLRKV